MSKIMDSSDIEISDMEISNKIQRLPNFLKILFFVEMWERFSYYGMRSLLVIFLTSQLGFKDEKAYAIYSLFAAIGYAGPVLAGFLADKLVGFRSMVLIGGVIIIIGHAVMSFVELKTDFIYLGLALIAVGTGMFKGNISNLLGSCYNENDSERNRGFTIFYVGINLGAFLASLSCGYVAHLYGWNYGFGLAGIGMMIGLITFINFEYILKTSIKVHPLNPIRQKLFGIKTPTILFTGGLIVAILVAQMIMYSELFANVLAIIGVISFSVFVYIILKLPSEQRKKLIVLLILIVFLMCFFALEMQLGSLIALFTHRNVHNEILGMNIPAAVSQAINPLAIIILGSMMSSWMKFNSKYITATFGFGILTMAICFFILYMGCLNANSEGQVGYIYIIVGISIMSLGELCIGPVLNSQATLLSPNGLRGLTMGMIMLALAFSNLAGIVIAKFMSIPSVNGEVNHLESLSIYQEGFFNIAIFNLGFVVIFLVFYKFINKVISKQ